MARILIVGCGCRGQALARELTAAGHAVRGTTRSPERLPEIEAAGAEAVVANPDRLGSVVIHLQGVSLVCWLMGSADSAEVHGPRLRTLLERLVDTPVRGVVYEPAAGMDADHRAAGVAAVQEATTTWRIPAEVVDTDPTEHEVWLATATGAVTRLLVT